LGSTDGKHGASRWLNSEATYTDIYTVTQTDRSRVANFLKSLAKHWQTIAENLQSAKQRPKPNFAAPTAVKNSQIGCILHVAQSGNPARETAFSCLLICFGAILRIFVYCDNRDFLLGKTKVIVAYKVVTMVDECCTYIVLIFKNITQISTLCNEML